MHITQLLTTTIVLANLLTHASAHGLQKRNSNYTEYEVVMNGDGSIIGQLVGIAKYFAFNGKSLVPSVTHVNICLDIEPTIPQNPEKYPIKDLVKRKSGIFDSPLQVNVREIGGQYCADVPKFDTAEFAPILRKDVQIIGRDYGSRSSAEKMPIFLLLIAPFVGFVFLV